MGCNSVDFPVHWFGLDGNDAKGICFVISLLTGFTGVEMAEMVGKAEQERSAGKAGRRASRRVGGGGLGRALGVIQEPKGGESEVRRRGWTRGFSRG